MISMRGKREGWLLVDHHMDVNVEVIRNEKEGEDGKVISE